MACPIPVPPDSFAAGFFAPRRPARLGAFLIPEGWMSAPIFHVPDAMHSVTLRVSGVPELRLRTWLAGKLLVLAAYVLGCGIEIELSRDGAGEV